jgi:hypothetical protein
VITPVACLLLLLPLVQLPQSLSRTRSFFTWCFPIVSR